MMTAYAMNDLIKEAIKEGAFACISKPFEIEDVLNTVKEINAKKAGLVISGKNEDAKNIINADMKSAGFITANKESCNAALEFINRREPELIFVIEPQESEYESIRAAAKKLDASVFAVITGDESAAFEGIRNIKRIKPPLNKDILAGFFADSEKSRAVIISGDAIWSNNLKLALIAKGYEASYYLSAEAFFGGPDTEKCDFVICDAGDITDADGFFSKIKEKNGKAKIILIFDFESSVSESLKRLDISFLQKPFDSHELLEVMEKAKKG
jgi:FixJ family two-component response regulator